MKLIRFAERTQKIDNVMIENERNADKTQQNVYCARVRVARLRRDVCAINETELNKMFLVTRQTKENFKIKLCNEMPPRSRSLSDYFVSQQ